LHEFRSYPRQELELTAGFVLVIGANGAGKTNLLEAVHVGAQGFSFRTRRDGATVRFGAKTARVELNGRTHGSARFSTSVTVDRSGSKRLDLSGAAGRSQEDLRRLLPVLAFTPDRLAVVKGGPVVRRTYLDRMIGRLWPPKADLPTDYGAALAQRNTALRRVRQGVSTYEALAPWDATLADLAASLDEARVHAVTAIASLFSNEAAELGLHGATLDYQPSGVTAELLSARYERDVERGFTGVGPHLQDLELAVDGADLRVYGSQGQQRLAVLALVLAEARLVADLRDDPPLLLLDDVLSELDDGRRKALLDRAPEACQVVVTATAERVLPPAARQPDQIVDVVPGSARSR
jgi:DNA replication and repair protein RecF